MVASRCCQHWQQRAAAAAKNGADLTAPITA
jgi:hypothetical protein